MSIISGLSAPNPYAQQVRPSATPTVVGTPGRLPERAELDRVSFTPDWMQDERGSPSSTNSIYGASGNLEKLPGSAQAAREMQPEKAQGSN